MRFKTQQIHSDETVSQIKLQLLVRRTGTTLQFRAEKVFQYRGGKVDFSIKNSTWALIVLVGLLAAFLSYRVSPGSAHSVDTPASLSGQVKFEGTPPKPSPIDMSAYPSCVNAHPTAATTEDIVVGGNGGLANVVVYVSEGLGTQTFPPPDRPVVFEQKGCQYKPHVLAMQAHQKLDIVNNDETTHSVHPTPSKNREWDITQPHGVPLGQTFAFEEVAIPVTCDMHPWMKGYIAVLDHPFFAVTDENGSFELKDLPPGTYTITAWQENLGTQSQKVTVAASEKKTVNFTFKP
jgi:plastocyanin